MNIRPDPHLTDPAGTGRKLTCRIAVLLVPAFSRFALHGFLEPLRLARRALGAQEIEIRLLSGDGQPVIADDGDPASVDGAWEDLHRDCLAVVVSGRDIDGAETGKILAFLRRQKSRGIRFAAIDTASYLFAKGGLIAGKTCAVHPSYHPLIKEQFPDVILSRNTRVESGGFWSCSGGVASTDLALDMVLGDHGSSLVRAISQQLVYGSFDPGRSRDRLPSLAYVDARNLRLSKAVELMERNIEHPLRMAEVARAVGVTQRQLERIFRKTLNMTPSAYYREIRMLRAHALLVRTEMTAVEVSVAVGASCYSNFLRSYRTVFGCSPSQIPETKTAPYAFKMDLN